MSKRILLALLITEAVQSVTMPAKAESRVGPNADSAAFYMRAGKGEQIARRYPQAWGLYEKAAKFNPSSIEPQLAIAEVCQQMNRMAPAIKALEEASRINPSDAKVAWKLSKLYFSYGQYEKVIAMLPQTRQAMPDAPGYDFMMGKSYYSIQNYGKGISHMKLAIKEDDQNAEAYYLVGHMYSLMENYKPSLYYYEKALILKPDEGNGARMYEFAMVQATAGEYENSIKWFSKALESGYKARDDFYMNFAYTQADAKKSEKAVEIMEVMLERRPQDMSLLNGLADICYHAGMFKKAISYWDRVLAIDEKNARPLYHIGMAYIKMGNVKEGQTLCDRAIAMDPALALLRHEKKM
jgi:tetratricopeptide (TPR) repeat protein